jgi:hypothetical protein
MLILSSYKNCRELVGSFCDRILFHDRAWVRLRLGIMRLHNLNRGLLEHLRLLWCLLQHELCWSYSHHLRHRRFLKLCICFSASTIPYLAFVLELLCNRLLIGIGWLVWAVCPPLLLWAGPTQLRRDSRVSH